MSLAGKTALITGASRGIGRAIAKGFAGAGANVVLIARSAELLKEVVEEIECDGGRAIYRVASVENEELMRQAFESAIEEFKGIDIVVANAGVNSPSGALVDMVMDECRQMFEANVFGVFNTCKLAVRYFSEKGGNIITIGSGIGHLGAANNSVYSASKAASWMITKSLALELLEKNINVNELIPGPVKTDMNPGASGPMWKSPEEVVPLALFIAQSTKGGPTGQSFSLMRR